MSFPSIRLVLQDLIKLFFFLQVIRTLDPKQNQGAAPEIQALKNQLQERDRMFHSLEVVILMFPGRCLFPHWFLGVDWYFYYTLVLNIYFFISL